MCSSQRPENGADSENHVDPPMEELPRATHQMVEQYVRQAMPNASDKEVASEVSRVVMADALGRAIHTQRGPGEVLDMGRCVRVNRDGAVEPVPYGYDDQKEDGYACDCEQIALMLVETIRAQDAMHQTKTQHIIVANKGSMN